MQFHPERKWRFDFSWPEAKVALEIQGGAWKYGRHNRAAGYLKDLERMNEAQLLGWLVLQVTPEELEWGRAAHLVLRAFELRSPR